MQELAFKIGTLFLEQPILEITPVLGKGRINQIFIVQTKTEEIVLRINVFFPAEDALEGYTKEQRCLEQAAAVGVPGPSVLHIGLYDGQAYMVQSRVPGENGEDSPAEKKSVWREMGRYSRLIHSIAIPVEEQSRPESPNGLFGSLSCAAQGSWLRQVQEGIDVLSSAGDVLEGFVYPKNQREKLAAKFEELKTLPFRSGLNHGDLSLKNVMVDTEGYLCLLDWGSALVHLTPYYDLSQMMKSQIESNDPDAECLRAFLGGYGISSSDVKEVCSNSAYFLLLRTFGKVRWALGCNHPRAQSFASLARSILTGISAGSGETYTSSL